MNFLVLNGPLPLETREWYRASGKCLCELCGLEYWRHPMDHYDLSYAGEPFMNVLCNGDRVKL